MKTAITIWCIHCFICFLIGTTYFDKEENRLNIGKFMIVPFFFAGPIGAIFYTIIIIILALII